MTPENVLKASELIQKLKSLRRIFDELKAAEWIEIITSKGASWTTDNRNELFQEVHALLVAQTAGDIDRTERQLHGLGVELPAPDFVNLTPDDKIIGEIAESGAIVLPEGTTWDVLHPK